MKSRMRVCAVTLTVAILVVSLLGANWSPGPATTWEYKVHSDLMTKQKDDALFVFALNNDGQAGWEAISVWVAKSGRTTVLLKRPK